MPTTADYVKGEVLSTLGRSCPQLRRLRLSASDLSYEISMSKIYQLYELCPNLISFNYSSSIFIDVNDQSGLKYRLVGIDQLLRDEKEMFLECICFAVERSQCKLTVSNEPLCYDLNEQHDDWVLMKSKLCPYLTDLYGYMSESILIEEVKELPPLEKLTIKLQGERFTDLSLAAITEYGYSLKRLSINTYSSRSELCSFSDEIMSKMIRNCKMLEWLDIPGAGYESVLQCLCPMESLETVIFSKKPSFPEKGARILKFGHTCTRFIRTFCIDSNWFHLLLEVCLGQQL
eukprot:scaffold1502_cov154-Ochromonas_danica.AAC.1